MQGTRHGEAMSTELSGPWDRAFYVDLPAKLRSKSNYRQGKKGWGALVTFESVVAAVLAEARPDGWDLGEKKRALKDRPVLVMAVVATSLVDSTNFTKSVADAMEGVLVVNDASILGSATLAERTRDNQRCGVAVAQLPAGSSIADQAVALQELVGQLPGLFQE